MDIVTHRRNLHRIPELDKALPKTMAYLEKALSGLGCRVFSPMESALAAFFDFGRDQTIAFRADADALPIQEDTGAGYASCHPGRMHACGHDGHMAILLELAARLGRKHPALRHNILLVFQPAEETTGGALALCRTGIFQKYNTKAIFGLHLWPGLPGGQLFSRPGEMMSRSTQVDLEIFGKSSHIAKPGEGLDALAAGVEFYDKARALEAALPESVPRLLNFGLFQSGTVNNAVSSHTRMSGTLRAFQDAVFESLRDGLIRSAREVEAGTGCRFDLTMQEGYPAVTNPPALYQTVSALLPFRYLEAPSMTTEDFGWYQRHLPGMFFFLGLGDVPALHARNFDFDDALLTAGADFFEELAVKFP